MGEDMDMPLEGHLSELRRRILVCVVPLIIGLVPAYFLSPFVLERIFWPVTVLDCRVYLYAVTDGLMLRLRAALLLDIAVLAPLILTEAFLFARPGLYPKEKRALILWSTGTGALFTGGVAAFLLWLGPFLVRWWHGCGEWEAALSGSGYMTMWEAAALIFALICCLPLLWPLLVIAKRKWE